MSKKIKITGEPKRKIKVEGTPKRRLDPNKVAKALGAEPFDPAGTKYLNFMTPPMKDHVCRIGEERPCNWAEDWICRNLENPDGDQSIDDPPLWWIAFAPGIYRCHFSINYKKYMAEFNTETKKLEIFTVEKTVDLS